MKYKEREEDMSKRQKKINNCQKGDLLNWQILEV